MTDAEREVVEAAIAWTRPTGLDEGRLALNGALYFAVKDLLAERRGTDAGDAPR